MGMPWQSAVGTWPGGQVPRGRVSLGCAWPPCHLLMALSRSARRFVAIPMVPGLGFVLSPGTEPG